MHFLRRINWTITLFLILTPIISIVGTVWIIRSGNLHWLTVVLAVIYTGVTGLAITAGYHRLLSHRAYQTVWPVRLLFLLFGAASFEGSALEWCTDHRRHHLYVDTDRDPYNIKRGFWYAHIGWLFFLDTSKRDFSNVKDLAADPLIHLQHRFFVPIAIIMGFIFPLAIASLWGDPWGGLILAGVARVTFNQQLTFCINSVCHVFGKQTYSNQSGRDNWFTALFTYGEGFHNYHHQFMYDYRNGIRFYHFDPAKWLIATLAFFGLAKDLKRVSKRQIIRYRIRTDEGRLLHQIKHYSDSLVQQAEHVLKPLRERILHTAHHLEQLEKDYQALKQRKMEYLREKMNDYRRQLRQQRQQLRSTQLELKQSLSAWREFMRSQPELLPALHDGN